SGHGGYAEMDVPEQCPELQLIKERDTVHNTDEEGDPDLECREEPGAYYFSGAGDSHSGTSIFGSDRSFASALWSKRSAPTLLVYGGRHATHQEYSRLENNWDHEVERRSCGLDGESLAVKFSKLTERDVSDALKELDKESEQGRLQGPSLPPSAENGGSTKSTAKQVLKTVQTTSRGNGLSPEAVKTARTKSYAFQTYFGLHAIFLSISPDDENDFRIRLFACPGVDHPLPSAENMTDEDCILDFVLRKKQRTARPGACSMEYQNAMDIVLRCLLGWDSKKQSGRCGIFGMVEAWIRADEEQGRLTLHGHWLIWIRGFNRLRSLMQDSDKETRTAATRKHIDYINSIMSTSLGDDVFIGR
ncbi:hypothetical protein THAOC_06050, partial [Thalassiosira oceanica]